MKKITLLLALVIIMAVGCQKNFLEVGPQGVASGEQLKSKTGVNALLVGAYSLLDGVGSGTTQWHGSVDNWVFGGVVSDDSYKGTDAGDQPEQSFLEQYNWLSDNTHLRGKWQHLYDAISRCNETIQIANDPAVKEAFRGFGRRGRNDKYVSIFFLIAILFIVFSRGKSLKPYAKVFFSLLSGVLIKITIMLQHTVTPRT
jgi:hypothetical protein